MISKKNIALTIALGLSISPVNAETLKVKSEGLYLADSLNKPITYYKKNMDETYSKYPICVEKKINGYHLDVIDCHYILAVVNEMKSEKNIILKN